MSFNTQLNTLHQRLLEAVREEHGEHNSAYSLMDLAEDLDDAEDVEEYVEDLLTYDQEGIYSNFDGDHFQRWLNNFEGYEEPAGMIPLPPRGVDPYEIPPLYEDAIIDPPPYVELPPY
jgi:hypothetical protein